MNCIKFRSIAFKNTFSNIYLAITISLFSVLVVEEQYRISEWGKVDVSIWTQKEVVFKRGTKSCESDSAIKDSTNFLIVSGKQVYRLINNELNPDFKSIN
jgi:hypothetical protein